MQIVLILHFYLFEKSHFVGKKIIFLCPLCSLPQDSSFIDISQAENNSVLQRKMLASSPGTWQLPDVLPLGVGVMKTKCWRAALLSVDNLDDDCLPPCLGMGSVCASSDDLASVNSVPEFEEVFQILVSLLKLFQTTSVRKITL